MTVLARGQPENTFSVIQRFLARKSPSANKGIRGMRRVDGKLVEVDLYDEGRTIHSSVSSDDGATPGKGEK